MSSENTEDIVERNQELIDGNNDEEYYLDKADMGYSDEMEEELNGNNPMNLQLDNEDHHSYYDQQPISNNSNNNLAYDYNLKADMAASNAFSYGIDNNSGSLTVNRSERNNVLSPIGDETAYYNKGLTEQARLRYENRLLQYKCSKLIMQDRSIAAAIGYTNSNAFSGAAQRNTASPLDIGDLKDSDSDPQKIQVEYLQRLVEIDQQRIDLAALTSKVRQDTEALSLFLEEADKVSSAITRTFDALRNGAAKISVNGFIPSDKLKAMKALALKKKQKSLEAAMVSSGAGTQQIVVDGMTEEKNLETLNDGLDMANQDNFDDDEQNKVKYSAVQKKISILEEKYVGLREKLDNERLKSLLLSAKLREIESKKNSQNEKGDGDSSGNNVNDRFRAIDYEQLQIENKSLAEKLESRSEELLQLRRRTVNALQIFSHVREKEHFVSTQIFNLKRELAQQDAELATLREKTTKSKMNRLNVKQKIQNIVEMEGLVGNSLLLNDYNSKLTKAQELKDNIKALKQHHEEIMAAIAGCEKEIEDLKRRREEEYQRNFAI